MLGEFQTMQTWEIYKPRSVEGVKCFAFKPVQVYTKRVPYIVEKSLYPKTWFVQGG